MKKAAAILLVLVMCFAIVACEGDIRDYIDDSITETPADTTNTDEKGDTVNNITEGGNSPVVNEKNPVATITMENGGVIRVELYPDVAPQSVYNFVSLANSGYYNGLIFHRIIAGFMIQGGCPNGTGMGGPGYSILGEFAINGVENNLSHTTGTISMARSGDPNSGGSQFFICVSDEDTFLDGQYAGFGKVIEGIEVALDMSKVATDPSDKPVTEQKIKTVTIDTKGETYPEPDKY